ncbi:unnamed protein product [Schistosoma mattheei]|uniref:Kelch_3 domain-containing protein n=1 Tax=Schistosoma mattheei TaxID=31246 RepID=A0A3P8KRB6_9TREM|nr:unnamed protein product [Schistosoma mattheei]
MGTCVYVIGGFDGNERLNTVYSLDIAQREEGWRLLTPMHYKRGLSAACTNKGRYQSMKIICLSIIHV